ncbi:hypothetical protein F5888DRAFT_1812229 [Russula emetica]|nr:hypothetical protein F5888DRAFT_1812229 [Russula emetica]
MPVQLPLQPAGDNLLAQPQNPPMLLDIVAVKSYLASTGKQKLMWQLIVDEHRARRGNTSGRVFTLPPQFPPLPMSSPSSVIDIPAVPDDPGPKHINPTTSSRLGSFTYDREEASYNLEWESRADFDKWLTHEQAAIGIEIWVSKTRASKTRELYSTYETLRCARNGTGGKKNYTTKTTRERKIDSKWIEDGCPCFVQIKTYPHTNTVLGKYNPDHSHPTGKDNLKYIRIRRSARELIESWVHYGVTDQEINKKIREWISADERDHYITNSEICRIRKEVLRADIRLDANDAHSTRIWVNKLQSQGDFVYYKDK